MLSMLWGSEYRDLVRMVFPFLPFVLASAVVKSHNDIERVLYAIILGYTIPILGSTLLIVLGTSQTFIGSSMLERQSGMSSGVHTLGHAMLFFSFVFAFYILMTEREKKSAEFSVIMLLFLLSVFCLYKSFTRTVLLGALIFWSIYLWRKNKKALLLLAAVGSLILLFYTAEVQNLIWQTRGLSRSSYDVNTASSGRVWIWEHNMKILSDQPITRIFLGVGLGHELDLVPESHMKWAGSHNDYLSLTIMLGVLGLFIYLLIYLASFITTIRSKISKDHKYLFVAITASVSVMNFVSNSYIVRFQMAQFFWLFIGLFISLQACEAGAQAKDSRRSR
jgi:O-antigen ligase